MGATSEIFRHIDNEESFNDFFAGLVSTALDNGPTVLNEIHEGFQFSSQAAVVGTQRNGYGNHISANESNRTLDWVIEDDELLIGYESKRGKDVPKDSQLREELRKLNANSNTGQQPVLFVFTDHMTEPRLLDDDSIRWLSWYDVADRILTINTDDPAIKLLQTMFEETDYDGFSGFTTFEQSPQWLVRHDTEFVNMAFELDRHLDGVKLYTAQGSVDADAYTSRSIDLLRRKDYISANHAYLTAHYHPTGLAQAVQNNYRISVLVPAMSNDIFLCLDMNGRKNNEVQEFVKENSQQLITLVNNYDLTVKTSYNSFNNPDHELLEYDSEDELEMIFQKKCGESNWKRLLFGWDIAAKQPPKEIVRECVSRIHELNDVFFESSDYFDSNQLPVSKPE
ncbi:hypothetical protein [Haloplanus salilacus]|uniref:hypothetical protein n=1 Tax=Haloplanus salilacus TaxID=2949994 RepID=UPI0030CD0EDB